MPAEFRRLTPAEFYAVAVGRIKDRNDQYDFHDQLNAKQCVVIALSGNVTMKDGRVPTERDFLLHPSDEPDTQSEDNIRNGLIMWSNAIKREVR